MPNRRKSSHVPAEFWPSLCAPQHAPYPSFDRGGATGLDLVGKRLWRPQT